jgi:hypothetical protein
MGAAGGHGLDGGREVPVRAPVSMAPIFYLTNGPLWMLNSSFSIGSTGYTSIIPNNFCLYIDVKVLSSPLLPLPPL